MRSPRGPDKKIESSELKHRESMWTGVSKTQTSKHDVENIFCNSSMFRRSQWRIQGGNLAMTPSENGADMWFGPW